MSIKSMVKAFFALRDIEDFTEALASGDLDELALPIREELGKCSEEAMEIILKSVAEKDFVVAMLMIQKGVVAEMAAQGKSGILLAEMSGDLQSYTQNVVLATIGLLIQDEVL